MNDAVVDSPVGAGAEEMLAHRVKDEPADTPQAVSEIDNGNDAEVKDLKSESGAQLDKETVKAIAAAQNEYNTRIRPPPSARRPSDMASSSPPATATGETPPAVKKRPAPKPSSIKPKKPSSKKRKLDTDKSSKHGTPLQDHTPSARATTSPAPSASSDVTDDGAVYCICRKPDNHTFMIGCDGGCEDWFHGACVSMHKADEDLVDKYICPNCAELGRGVTTWKPMCRKEGCRKPARLRRGDESKYCSEECGRAFMAFKLGSSVATAHAQKAKKAIPKRTLGEEQSNGVEDLGPLGGTIRTSHLKSLVLASPSTASFHHLGSSGVLTPPGTASPSESIEPVYTEAETQRLAAIADRKDALRTRRSLLKDRERFVTLAKERAGRTARDLGAKEVCGFDPRLSWDELRFATWCTSAAGQAAFAQDTLDTEGGEAKDQEMPLCTRKRCERHRAWQKLATQDVRFEEADVGDEMRRIDGEERAIRQRAVLRARSGAKFDEEQGGTVEVVVLPAIRPSRPVSVERMSVDRTRSISVDGDGVARSVSAEAMDVDGHGVPFENPYQHHREILGRALG